MKMNEYLNIYICIKICENISERILYYHKQVMKMSKNQQDCVNWTRKSGQNGGLLTGK